MALIPSALQPAEVEQVLLCDMIGRAIVLVKDDQLSQAIGKYGQNVRLASKLVGWDIEIMTSGELEEQIDRAVGAFMELQGMTDDLAQRLVEQGYLSYDDLSVIEPDALMEMGGMSAEQVDAIVEQADERAEEAERIAEEQKRLKKERELAEQLSASQSPASPDAAPSSASDSSPAGDVAVADEASEDGESGADGDQPEMIAAEATDASTENDSEENLNIEQAESISPAANAPEEAMDKNDVTDRI